MMSGAPLETCWAFKKLCNNKFYYKAASCWLFLQIHCWRICGLLWEPDALRWSSWFEQAEFLTCTGRYSDDQKWHIKWAIYVVRVWDNRTAYSVLVGKRIGKGQLGRSRSKREDNIKLDLKEIGRVAYTGFIWIKIRESGELLWMRSWTLGLHKMTGIFGRLIQLVDSSWNVMAHGEAREGKWSRNWRMEWVASTLHTTSEHGKSSITTNNKNIRQAA